MKLPNGYGSVVKQSGNRRKPYAVRKTIGFNAKGYPIYRHIGYTATREEGLALLAKYNDCPWDLNTQKITMAELYDLWRKHKSRRLVVESAKALDTAFRHCSELHHLQYRNIKAFQMQQMLDKYPDSPSTQAKIKNLFSHLDKLALELDIPAKGYAQVITADPIEPEEKKPFTEAEIKKIWEHQNDPWADTVLMLIYMGWRISEFLSLKKDDIDLTARTIKGGKKTASGKRRIVPIHPRILPFVVARMDGPGDTLLNIKSTQYRKHWKRLMTAWGMEHTPHDCRHTFRTRLADAKVSKKCCDLLLGHKSPDVGERVYNHRTLDDLIQAVDSLE